VKRIRKLPEDTGHSRDLLMALRELHLRAGEPSMRAIARSTGRAVSHDTVHRVLTGPELPRWDPLGHVVKALNGDVETFRALWISARHAMEQDGG
jgi:hypothetical protein